MYFWIRRYGMLKFRGSVAFEMKEKRILEVQEHITNHNRSFPQQKQGRSEQKLRSTIVDIGNRRLEVATVKRYYLSQIKSPTISKVMEYR